jgi:hypothetical protein
MTIKPIRFTTQILDNPKAQSLIAEYAQECSVKEVGPINPQRDLYEKLENSGSLKSFGVFDEDEIVGFANVLVYVLPHYGLTIAATESLFVTKDYRVFGAWQELKKALKVYSKDAGCVGILYSAPVGGQLELLLEASKGFQRTSAVFFERIA